MFIWHFIEETGSNIQISLGHFHQVTIREHIPTACLKHMKDLMVQSYDIICMEVTYDAGGQNNESQVMSCETECLSVRFRSSDADIIPESQTTNPGSKVRCDYII